MEEDCATGQGTYWPVVPDWWWQYFTCNTSR